MFKKTLSLLMSLSLIGGGIAPTFYAESPQSSVQQKTDLNESIKEMKSKISHEEYKKLKENFKKLKKECKELEMYKDVKINAENNTPSLKELLITSAVTFCAGLPFYYLTSLLFKLPFGPLAGAASASIFSMLNWIITKL